MSRTFVIAEAGVNHNGDIGLAVELVAAAAEAGADAVKFQTFNADALATANAPKAAYQEKGTATYQTQREMLKALELPRNAYGELKNAADSVGLEFVSTPFDSDSLSFLVDNVGVKTLKIGSGDLTDGPLLLAAAKTGLPLIVSTGMSSLDEIAEALDVITFGKLNEGLPSGSDDFSGLHDTDSGRRALIGGVTLLHCTSLYPAPADLANLRAMQTIADRFGLPIGYSDHTEGTAVSLAAVALGAVTIEKHLTLDRTMDGPDHAASMEPESFADLVAGIRTIGEALGTSEKAPEQGEAEMQSRARKSLFAAGPVAAGASFRNTDLAAKRPGGGLSPMRFWDIIGSTAGRDYKADERIDP